MNQRNKPKDSDKANLKRKRATALIVTYTSIRIRDALIG